MHPERKFQLMHMSLSKKYCLKYFTSINSPFKENQVAWKLLTCFLLDYGLLALLLKFQTCECVVYSLYVGITCVGRDFDDW